MVISIGLAALGVVLLVIGVFMLFLPGPGVLILILGVLSLVGAAVLTASGRSRGRGR